MFPLPQHCTLPAHEKATLPLSLLPSLWPLPLRLPLPPPLPFPTPSPSLLPLPIAVAINHCCCGRCQPLQPPSLLRCCQPLPSTLPLPLAIAISVTIGQCSCHLHRPSLLPLPPAISECCCLGAARIVFNQLRQRMLTLFHFVWIVGNALIKVKRGRPTSALGSEWRASSR